MEYGFSMYACMCHSILRIDMIFQCLHIWCEEAIQPDICVYSSWCKLNMEKRPLKNMEKSERENKHKYHLLLSSIIVTSTCVCLRYVCFSATYLCSL